MPKHTPSEKAKNLRAAANVVRNAGRKGDTEVVHVNKSEIKMLKDMGGKGSKNPKTGFREFFFGGAAGSAGEQAGRELSENLGEAAGQERDRAPDVISRERELFDAGVSPTDENARGNLTPTQARVGQALRLASGLVIPGAGVVSAAARGLEFLFGPGQEAAFRPAATSGVQGPGGSRGAGDIGFSRDAAEFQTRSGAPTAARTLSRSANAARTRTEGSESANVADPRVTQVAALARRRGEASGGGRGQTVLTTLRGLFGGSGFAKKKLLGN